MRLRGGPRRGPQLDARSWTEDVIAHLELLYSVQGLLYDEIAPRLGKTPAAVHTEVRLLGLKLTPQARARRRALRRAMKGVLS